MGYDQENVNEVSTSIAPNYETWTWSYVDVLKNYIKREENNLRRKDNQ